MAPLSASRLALYSLTFILAAVSIGATANAFSKLNETRKLVEELVADTPFTGLSVVVSFNNIIIPSAILLADEILIALTAIFTITTLIKGSRTRGLLVVIWLFELILLFVVAIATIITAVHKQPDVTLWRNGRKEPLSHRKNLEQSTGALDFTYWSADFIRFLAIIPFPLTLFTGIALELTNSAHNEAQRQDSEHAMRMIEK